jgi:hypothetical protein
LAWINSIPPVILGVITGLLPTVMLAVLMSLVPVFCRFAAKTAGYGKQASHFGNKTQMD